MENKTEVTTNEAISVLLNVIAYGISPILMIWSVNTLFETNIPLSFKTWLAGLVLVMLIRFHVRQPTYTFDPYPDDYDFEDEFDFDDDDSDLDPEERKSKLMAKIIAYQDHLNKKEKPPTES